MERVGLIGFRSEGKIKLCVGRRSRPTHNFFLPCGPVPGSTQNERNSLKTSPEDPSSSLEKRKALEPLGYGLTRRCNCSKDHIQAMVLRKRATSRVCSHKARTAAPTGSSPAAPPPGASAYAP